MLSTKGLPRNLRDASEERGGERKLPWMTHTSVKRKLYVGKTLREGPKQDEVFLEVDSRNYSGPAQEVESSSDSVSKAK